VWLVAAFSFLTTSGDAPGKQASVFVRVDILQEFRVLAGIRGRNAHRGQQPPKYDHTKWRRRRRSTEVLRRL
jgi:hypothetical protein